MKHVDYSKIVSVCVCIYVCVLTSCQPDPICRENLKVGLIGELREIYYDQNEQPQLCTQWDSILVMGVGNSDTLYANEKHVQKLTLPLRIAADSTQYILTYHGATDTMTIEHTSQQEFVSSECGCLYSHDLLSVHSTNHWIDSIEIISTDISRMGESNICIWRER